MDIDTQIVLYIIAALWVLVFCLVLFWGHIDNYLTKRAFQRLSDKGFSVVKISTVGKVDYLVKLNGVRFRLVLDQDGYKVKGQNHE